MSPKSMCLCTSTHPVVSSLTVKVSTFPPPPFSNDTQLWGGDFATRVSFSVKGRTLAITLTLEIPCTNTLLARPSFPNFPGVLKGAWRGVLDRTALFLGVRVGFSKFTR